MHTGHRLAAARCLVADQRIAAATGMRIQHVDRCRLAPERGNQRQQQAVLEHIRVVAGVESVTVVHAADFPMSARVAASSMYRAGRRLQG